MSEPNTEMPLPEPGSAPRPEDGGQKTEDGNICCPPSSVLRRLWSALRRLLPALRHPPRPLWLGSAAAAVLCVVGVIVLLRGCGGRETIPPTPQMGVESQFWVRVLLLHHATEGRIEVPSAFRIATADPGHETTEAGLRMEPCAEPTRINVVDGQLMLGATTIAGKEIVLSPESPYVFGLDGRQYRGKLKLIVNSNGREFDAVNLVPLEPYLAGVVGEEMPNYWEPEALRAQAIAARTYCLYVKNRFGAKRCYDVRRTQSSQVYGGLAAESVQVWEAVNSTCGQVLMAPELMTEGKAIADLARGPNPQSAIRNPQFSGLFPAYFSSSCGGHTSSSEEVFGDRFGPLQGVPCPYCKDVAKLGLFYWPMAGFDRETITRQLAGRYPKLQALGEITNLEATEETCYGTYSRLRRIRVTGATGKTDTLRAEDLRLAIDPSGRRIKSAICRIVPWENGWAFIAGRGWGHGVGLCQCGAEGMARLGSSVQDILQYYYPGAEIVSIY